MRCGDRLAGVWWLVVVLGLAGCGGGSDAPAEAAGASQLRSATAAVRAEPMTRSAAQGGAEAGLTQRVGQGPRARAIVLGEVSREKIAAQTPLLNLRGVPRKLGFARPIAEVATPAATALQLDWQTLASGARAAAISVTSPQATGVRVGLRVGQLPSGATVRAYAQGASLVYETPAADILAALQRNAAAGDRSEDGRTWWAPLVEGDEATIEIELPAGVDPELVDIALPRLSHLFESPVAKTGTTAQDVAKIGEAARCEVDVSCSTAYQAESNSVARMLFVDGGDSYLCSGTLLTDRGNSGVPYFLSANHCISTQTVASTLQTFWFYRSASCNALVLDPTSTTLTNGATLLYATSATDTSFMQLNSLPPLGTVYAGWSVDAPALAAPVFGLHHPEGDLQKVSTGTIDAFERCTASATNDGDFSCTTTSQANGTFVNVLFSSGTTEAGSSGSPLFRTVNGTRYLTGQLYGGSASCRNRSGDNAYGRFDVAYRAGLQTWLDAVHRSPVYRFYNVQTGAHFYTVSRAERDFVVATYPQFHYEVAGLYAYAAAGTGLSPVYRFYNPVTGAHFYTISEAERAFVVATYPVFQFEGVAWYAQSAAGSNTSPVYRFFHTGNGTHFYSASTAERDFVIASYPVYQYEGLVYYAWTGF